VNNIATIGFTPFMRHKLRPIVFVEPYIKIGDNVPQYSLLLRIETPHFYKEMIMPADGQIININPDWTIQCKLDNGHNQSGALMSLAEYTKYVDTL
jgi:glycine cleavage system H lipoate-binding protein|tara:strand:+ start:694 stop:981 length:288 start_codon:yes stop_codon:yes gene_type:complete